MGLGKILKKLKTTLRGTFKIPRWGYNNPPHHLLYRVIDRRREDYKTLLEKFLAYREGFLKIPLKPNAAGDTCEPHLDNDWLPLLDSFALYAFLSVFNPEVFMEVGSGNSTKFARRAINDQKLKTRIISVDPEPRVEIDRICDEVVRKPVEELPLRFFDALDSGDFLFVDGSHRSFMNSDVTAVFIDILPRLKPGVIVEIHDIFLPYDYPPQWSDNLYSEQYLLAAYLLSGGGRFEILLPNNFVANDPELNGVLSPLFPDERRRKLSRYSGSFWMVIR